MSLLPATRQAPHRHGLLTLTVDLLLAMVFVVSTAHADGTERLGPPVGLDLAQGTDLHTAGTSLRGSAGELRLTLPDAAVRQAILHWESHARVRGAVGGTDALLVGGRVVVGDCIGGATLVSPPERPAVWSATYRADVTDLLPLHPGENVLSVLGNPVGEERSGVGLTVVTDDGRGSGGLFLADGHDFARAGRRGENATTEPVVFGFEPAVFTRRATMHLQFATGAPRAPSVVVVQFPGERPQVFVDVIDPDDGGRPTDAWSLLFGGPCSMSESGWAVVCLHLEVPVTADAVAVRVLSLDSLQGAYAGHPEAELRWTTASFGLLESKTPQGLEGCTPGSWKQPKHFDDWPAPYDPTDLFVDAFGEDAFPGLTLLDVLRHGD